MKRYRLERSFPREIREVQEKVKERFGVELEPEVKFLGEF